MAATGESIANAHVPKSIALHYTSQKSPRALSQPRGSNDPYRLGRVSQRHVAPLEQSIAQGSALAEFVARDERYVWSGLGLYAAPHDGVLEEEIEVPPSGRTRLGADPAHQCKQPVL